MKEFKLGVQSYWYSISVRPKAGAKWIEYCCWKNYSIELFQRWKWYFKYRAALLQIKYPRYIVNQNWGAEKSTGLTKSQLEEKLNKNELTTAKRMVTKITNAIEKFEVEERKKLIPNWENPKYLRTKEKLIEYKNKLEKLTN
jgi:hypothetical protein